MADGTVDTPATRVVVAEDDVLLREGLASLLERSRFDVVAQAGNGRELVALVREHTPDLAIVDIRMPPTHKTEGLDAARAIREGRSVEAVVAEIIEGPSSSPCLPPRAAAPPRALAR